jgi:spermidine/putrescine transport system substrate-binding protein
MTQDKPVSMTDQSKRSFLTRTSTLVAAGVAATMGPWPLRYARGTEHQLTWLAYPGHATEEVVGPFQERFGVEIRSQEFTAGERMLALINSSPPGTFDVVMDDTPYIEILYRTGMLEPLDGSDYPLDDFYPELREWPRLSYDGTLYSVPTTWGYNGLAYNADVLTEEDVQSYSIMWEERMRGRVGMRDWYLPVMGCISAYLGHEQPYNITDEQLEEVVASMSSLAPSVTGFYGFSGVFDSLASGNSYVIPGCGDWITGLLQRDGHPIRSMAPKEGAISWMESNSIIRGTRNKDLAIEFIRYLSSPEGQIRTITKQSYMAAGVSRPAWEQLNAEMPEEAEKVSMRLDQYNILDMLREGRIHFRELPGQQSLDVWQDAYTRFMSAA